MQIRRINVIDEDILSFRPEWGYVSRFAEAYAYRFEPDGLFQQQISDTFRNLIDDLFSFYRVEKLPGVDPEQKMLLASFLSECLLVGYLTQSYNSTIVTTRNSYSINDFLAFSKSTNWLAQFNPATTILMDYLEKQALKNKTFLRSKPSQEKDIRQAIILNVMLGHHIAVWEGH